jgi:ATP-binding cassette subfamily C protein
MKSIYILFRRLLQYIQPLSIYLLITIIAGVLGYIFAMLIPITGVMIILSSQGWLNYLPVPTLTIVLISSGLLRGVFRYIEHYFGHFVAFKTLALFRDKVFSHLRTLSNKNLDEWNKGNLVSMISSDIEALEVFYAHTISPLIIALVLFLTTSTLLSFIVSFWFAIPVIIGYLLLGWFLPNRFHHDMLTPTQQYRELFSENNEHFLESIQGFNQIRYLNAANQRKELLISDQNQLESAYMKIKNISAKQRSIVDLTIYITIFSSVLLSIILYTYAGVSLFNILLGITIILSSFGPFLALSALPSTLNQTIASARRVFSLLDQKPDFPDYESEMSFKYQYGEVEQLSFQYGQRIIIDSLDLKLPSTGIIGIYGVSGSGKSTLIKILMGHLHIGQGNVLYNNRPIQTLDSKSLRFNIAYMDQHTYIFEKSFAENITFSNALNQTLFDYACQKAQLNDLISQLPNGIDTIIGRRYHNLSSGEKQRIGLARAFYWNASVFILDEPTSNIDSLNEALILQAIDQDKDNRLVVLVSHKPSTLSICDKIYEFKDKKLHLRK